MNAQQQHCSLPKCPIHATKLLFLVCKTCAVPICQSCFKDHSGHNMSDPDQLKDEAIVQQRKVLDTIAQLQATEANLNDESLTVDCRIRNLRDSLKKLDLELLEFCRKNPLELIRDQIRKEKQRLMMIQKLQLDSIMEPDLLSKREILQK